MILDVTPETSTAREVGLKGGEKIISLNGNHDFELIDFLYMIHEDKVSIEVEKNDGTIENYTLERENDKEIGLSISSHPIRRCKNKCRPLCSECCRMFRKPM